jgi:hypothetical protein
LVQRDVFTSLSRLVEYRNAHLPTTFVIGVVWNKPQKEPTRDATAAIHPFVFFGGKNFGTNESAWITTTAVVAST